MSAGLGRLLLKRRKDAEVIVVEDDEREPVSVLCSEVIELRQKLKKADDMFKRACHQTRTAELRAELAENLLESKKCLLENPEAELEVEVTKRTVHILKQLEEAKTGLEAEVAKRMVYVSKKLEETKKSLDATSGYNIELLRENLRLKEEANNAKGRCEMLLKDKYELTLDIASLKIVNESLSAKAAPNEEERKQFNEERMKDRARIAELTLKLGRYEKRLQPVQQPSQSVLQQLLSAPSPAVMPVQQLQWPQPDPAAAGDFPQLRLMKRFMERPPPAPETLRPEKPRVDLDENDELTIAELLQVQHMVKTPEQVFRTRQPDYESHSTAKSYKDFFDPINIFQLCRPDKDNSVSLEDASAQISLKFCSGAEKKWPAYCSLNNEGLVCGMCNMFIEKVDIFDHFFTQRHTKLIRARGGAVSAAALQHWLNELQQAASIAAVVAVPAAAAATDEQAAAAPESLFRPKEKVKKEEPEDE